MDVVEELGADAYVYGSTKAAPVDTRATRDGEAVHRPRRRPHAPGEGPDIYLEPKEGHVHLFDAETGLRIGD